MSTTARIVASVDVDLTDRGDARVADRLGHGRGWLVEALPVVMTDDPFLRRFTTVFEELASATRFAAESASDTADVTVAPLPMVQFLGQWVSAPGLHDALDEARQRSIVRAAGTTMAWRGTSRGLRELLEAATGAPVTIIDPGGVHRDGETPTTRMHVEVHLCSLGHFRAEEVLDVVRDEIPAHLPVNVLLDGRPLVPGTSHRTVAGVS